MATNPSNSGSAWMDGKLLVLTLPKPCFYTGQVEGAYCNYHLQFVLDSLENMMNAQGKEIKWVTVLGILGTPQAVQSQ